MIDYKFRPSNPHNADPSRQRHTPVSAMISVAFLVSDSRSGSTLLARHITEGVDGVLVTPELVFSRILRWRSLLTRRSVARQAQDLMHSPGMRNLPPEVKKTVIERAGTLRSDGARKMLQLVLETWCEIVHRDQPVSFVMVKGGGHISYWRTLNKLYGGRVHFIFVHRDPRAVVESKLRTRRPYAPSEVMAWGGALLAAIRWRTYSKAMRVAARSGLRVLDMKFESFIADPELGLKRVAMFLGTAIRDKRLAGAYKIPGPEQEIHPLVQAQHVLNSRVDTWRMRLNLHERKLIEAVCQSEMTVRGYEPVEGRTLAVRCVRCAVALPNTFLRIAAHFFRRLCAP